jgi:hypothetical protein
MRVKYNGIGEEYQQMTFGKIYEVIREFDEYYVVMTNSGWEAVFYKTNFDIVEQKNEMIRKEIKTITKYSYIIDGHEVKLEVDSSLDSLFLQFFTSKTYMSYPVNKIFLKPLYELLKEYFKDESEMHK